jgi:formylglycine-generating enzyme required for sulfatase activity
VFRAQPAAEPVGGAGQRSSPAAAKATDANLIALAGGRFIMDTDGQYGYSEEGEGPAHEVDLSPFSIARYPVTNTEFAAFVEATGHRTDAERFGWSFVFAGFLPEDFPATRAVIGVPWWRQVEGADWAHPIGPRSAIDDRADHPVVHVSWDDAGAFCAWTGSCLPTEAIGSMRRGADLCRLVSRGARSVSLAASTA